MSRLDLDAADAAVPGVGNDTTLVLSYAETGPSESNGLMCMLFKDSASPCTRKATKLSFHLKLRHEQMLTSCVRLRAGPIAHCRFRICEQSREGEGIYHWDPIAAHMRPPESVTGQNIVSEGENLSRRREDQEEDSRP
jgi:hypothetical protein